MSVSEDYTWLKKGKPKTKPLNGFPAKPKPTERCPFSHAAWHLYHKRIEGTTETIICCRECDKNAG